ncbi:zinc-dependent alcohol dehydrogenase family protein [Aquirufa nivalisilvae]|uniref:zinc-dependent alcohol dehydrogenase family protein n=1 Tax=Aquirufa nivalisilvae TaxID=2516557 RepID=UPI001032CF78|nr:zinc-dependent alcohol dehydrogenase family protein [Aquirufa nivalisilvae]TBH73906.1 zinc-binding dehydrogenase [Aquirufa nivalisilvae]
MKQVIFEQTGLPKDVLRLVDAPMPEPKAHEVRIQVLARNINPSDIMFIQGRYGIQPKLPSSAGFEAVGIIESTDSLKTYPVGTRVLFTALGTWKEYVCAPVNSVVPVPANMSNEIACQAFINPLTAYAMLEESGLKEGDKLLITAGASAWGKLVIQMAKQKGIWVAATVRQDSQKELLYQMGADLVINTDNEKVGGIMRENAPQGVKAIFDAVGGELAGKILSSLEIGGTMYVFGSLSLDNIPLNSGLLIFKNLTIKGFWLTSWMENTSPLMQKTAIKTVFEHLSKESIQVDVASSYPLEKFQEAIQAYETPGRNGKILLM